MQIAEGNFDMSTMSDRIKIDYRTRIEKETAGLNTHEATALTRQLEDEKDKYLQDVPAYVAKIQGRPSILKATRNLIIFDVASGDEHAVFLTREGQVPPSCYSIMYICSSA